MVFVWRWHRSMRLTKCQKCGPVCTSIARGKDEALKRFSCGWSLFGSTCWFLKLEPRYVMHFSGGSPAGADSKRTRSTFAHSCLWGSPRHFRVASGSQRHDQQVGAFPLRAAPSRGGCVAINRARCGLRGQASASFVRTAGSSSDLPPHHHPAARGGGGYVAARSTGTERPVGGSTLERNSSLGAVNGGSLASSVVHNLF